MNLQEIQTQVFKAVQQGGDIYSTTCVLSNIGISPAERLQAYQYSSFSKPYSCLCDDFAVTRRFLGEELFDSLVEKYLLQYPADTHFINECGRFFPNFLRSQVQNPVHPFIFDLAQMEWLFVESFFNFFDAFKDQETDSVPVEVKGIKTNASIIIFESAWPLDEAWYAEEPVDYKDSQIVIWTTDDRRVHCQSWNTFEVHVLKQLIAAGSLEQAVENLVLENFETEQLVRVFSEQLPEWVQLGLLDQLDQQLGHLDQVP